MDSHASLIPQALELGFQFHSAEKGCVLLSNWLPNSESKLPLGATHQVGVGAVVFNANREMLVVKERSGPLRDLKIWKMPTGLSNPGEYIPSAVEREVAEETGIDCKFKGVLAFRQANSAVFQKTDLFLSVYHHMTAYAPNHCIARKMS